MQYSQLSIIMKKLVILLYIQLSHLFFFLPCLSQTFALFTSSQSLQMAEYFGFILHAHYVTPCFGIAETQPAAAALLAHIQNAVAQQQQNQQEQQQYRGDSGDSGSMCRV